MHGSTGSARRSRRSCWRAGVRLCSTGSPPTSAGPRRTAPPPTTSPRPPAPAPNPTEEPPDGRRQAAVLRGGHREVRAGPRLRGARRAVDEDEDVLGRPERVRRRPQHERRTRRSRDARLAARRERAGRAVRDLPRTRARLLDRGVEPVRTEELLLPGPREELPDLP